MRRAHRTAHRLTWFVLALLLPLILAVAVGERLYRLQSPLVERLSPAPTTPVDPGAPR